MYEYVVVLNFDRIRFQVHTGWGADGLTGRNMEAPLVQRAFDNIIHHHTRGQVLLFVGA